MSDSIRVGWAAVALISALTGGCVGRTRVAGLFPSVAEHSNQEIRRVRFVGNEPFTADTLQAIIETQPTYCNLLGLPLCIGFLGGVHVHRLSVETVRRDIARLDAFFRREGYFGTRVVPRAEPFRPAEGPLEDEVTVTFVVRRGAAILLDTLVVDGLPGSLPADSLKQQLPLHEQEIFNLGKYEASADQILRELQTRGYAYAQVLRNYSVDTLTDRANASLTAVAGPQVHVDSIIIRGAEKLGARAALRQMTFRPGDLLQLSSFIESQRNLYSLEIVQIASVGIAPDSLQVTPTDSSTATVLVNVAEVPLNQAEAGIGLGSVECLRIDGQWTNRSFTGGGRRLNVSTNVSKLGVGGRTNAGWGGLLCHALGADSAQDAIDYRFSTEFTQPYFISPRNQLSLAVYAEQVSEPKLYQRTAEGGQITLNHRLAPRRLLTGSVEISRAKTIASPVLFCSAFQICIPEARDSLTLPRFRNTLGLNYLDEHTDNQLDPSRGHVLRTGIAWAAPWLSSSVRFVRWTGERALYSTLSPGYVLAVSLRLGNFFRTASIDPQGKLGNFLPPEERFYAGGANTVRGFTRNGLGPGAYVTDSLMIDSVSGKQVPRNNNASFVPTGGTSLGLLNAELRFPSPLFRRQMRLAAFVDGGAVASENIWNMDLGDWRFTPGLGARIATPVGPARVDIAYNPYRPVTGVLFVVDSARIVPVRDDYTPPRAGFFGRMRVHVAIGQAF